jgi:hypothetical protein
MRYRLDRYCALIAGAELDRLAWTTKLELMIAQKCFGIKFSYIWEFSECWKYAYVGPQVSLGFVLI